MNCYFLVNPSLCPAQVMVAGGLHPSQRTFPTEPWHVESVQVSMQTWTLLMSRSFVTARCTCRRTWKVAFSLQILVSKATQCSFLLHVCIERCCQLQDAFAGSDIASGGLRVAPASSLSVWLAPREQEDPWWDIRTFVGGVS